MEFNVNSPALFVIAGLIIAAVLAQSVYFLIKAWKRGLAIGMGKEKLRRIGEAVGAFEIRAMYTDDAKADGPLLAAAQEGYIVTHGVLVPFRG